MTIILQDKFKTKISVGKEKITTHSNMTGSCGLRCHVFADITIIGWKVMLYMQIVISQNVMTCQKLTNSN